MSDPNPGRALAARVLGRARKGKRFAGDELERALRGGALGREDRGLATSLVYGTLRHQGTLDWVLGRVAEVSGARTHPDTMDLLRLGAYQLLYLRRVPPFAAVDETVELVRRAGGRRSAGFANAVLRALARDLAPADTAASGSALRDLPRGDGTYAVFRRDLLPDPGRDPVQHVAVTLSLPAWLTARWIARFGAERTADLGRAFLVPPPTTLRVNRLRGDRDGLLALLRAADAEAQPGTDPAAIRLGAAGSVAQLPGYLEGRFTVQDEAAMAVAPRLAPHPGGRYVDLCAAPGGKSTHLAELSADAARIVALDPQAARLSRVAESCARLGLRSVFPVCGDGRRPPLPAPPSTGWDGVLIDAPCSNTGVLARRVEARWRLGPPDVSALAETQLHLLVSAAALVPPGGRVLYSTCSLEPEENDDRVALFLQGLGGTFREIERETLWPAPGRSGGFVALLERTRAE